MTVSGSSKNDSALTGRWGLGRRPLLWLNLLCLDAPVVALTWLLAFARTFRFTSRPAEAIALFLTAWSIYLTDRLVDSLAASPRSRGTARAQFCLRHRKPWSLVILIVTALDGAIILAAVPRPTIVRGVFVGVAALAYLAASTSRIKLATGVVQISARTPAASRASAALSWLSRSRTTVTSCRLFRKLSRRLPK